MRNIILVLLLSFTTNIMMGQSDVQYTASNESDPAAKKILDKLKTKFNNITSMEAKFTLEITIPEQDPIFQKGSFIQNKEKYRIEIQDKTIMSDGHSQWYHMQEQNEVQINNVEELDINSGVLTPTTLIKIYEKNEYVFILADEISKKGTIHQIIEFKPLDEDADIFKLTLVVDKKKQEIVSFKTFFKDGIRYKLILDKMTENKKYPNSTFVFDTKQYPDIYVEDLRD